MIYDTDFPKPVPSFPFPVALVTTEPDSEPYVCIKFNRDWLPYVLGSLAQLLLMATWNAATQDELNAQLQRANELIYLFQRGISCECPTPSTGAFVNDMPFFRQVCENNVCYLEFECCPGEWVRLGRADQIPASGQPGAGQPQPAKGGGTQQYCNILQASGQLNLGVLVNTGDTINLVSQTGAGWDGGEFDFGPLWRCPDGSQYIAGSCQPYTRTDSGDPVPTTNHMSVIVQLGSSYYSIEGGVFTVPSGIVNAPVIVQINDSALANNQGDYTLCIEVTNNQALPPSTWCHVWGGVYPQAGWTQIEGSLCAPSWCDDNDPSTPQVDIRIDAGTPFHLTGIDVVYTCDNTASRTSYWYKNTIATEYTHEDGLTTGTNVLSVKNIDDPSAQVVGIRFSAFSGHDMTISQISIRGIGTDPFTAPNC